MDTPITPLDNHRKFLFKFTVAVLTIFSASFSAEDERFLIFRNLSNSHVRIQFSQIIEALAKPGRGNVLVAHMTANRGQRGRSPSHGKSRGKVLWKSEIILKQAADNRLIENQGKIKGQTLRKSEIS